MGRASNAVGAGGNRADGEVAGSKQPRPLWPRSPSWPRYTRKLSSFAPPLMASRSHTG